MVPIYHRFGGESTRANPYSITHDQLVEHVEYFRKSHEPVSIDDMDPDSTSKLVITVDDGWHSFYDRGLDWFRELNVPVLLFVNPGFVLRENTPSLTEVHGAMSTEEDRYMTEEELKTISEQSDVIIGSHGMQHVDLRKETNRDVIHREIVDSKHALEDALQQPVRHFSFPKCRYNPQSLNYAREHYDVVFTLRGEINAPQRVREKPWHLHRIECSGCSLRMLKFKRSFLYRGPRFLLNRYKIFRHG